MPTTMFHGNDQEREAPDREAGECEELAHEGQQIDGRDAVPWCRARALPTKRIEGTRTWIPVYDAAPAGSAAAPPAQTPRTARSDESSTASARCPGSRAPRSPARPIARAGVDVSGGDRVDERHACGDRPAQRLVLSQGRTGDRAALGEPGDRVDDVDFERAEVVAPVRCTRRRHRVGDQCDPARRGGERQPHHVGMQMHAVGDHLERHTMIGCRSRHRTRMPVVKARHRVERVREDRGAGIERGQARRVVRSGVPDRGGAAGVDDEPDRVEPAGQLGGERHLADRAATRFEQPLDVAGGRAPAAASRRGRPCGPGRGTAPRDASRGCRHPSRRDRRPSPPAVRASRAEPSRARPPHAWCRARGGARVPSGRRRGRRRTTRPLRRGRGCR